MKTIEQIQLEFVDYPQLGRLYQHYKGGIYEVLHLAKHSETDETMVVYQSKLYGSYHVRPLSMWNDIIYQDTENVPIRYYPIKRFELYNG
jgi:hypothetical protein